MYVSSRPAVVVSCTTTEIICRTPSAPVDAFLFTTTSNTNDSSTRAYHNNSRRLSDGTALLHELLLEQPAQLSNTTTAIV